LSRRPPAQWGDEDYTVFGTALREVARRFHTLEPIAFDSLQHEVNEEGVHSLPKRIRLSVTVQHGDEYERVISIHPEDVDIIDHMYRLLLGALDEKDVTLQTKIAALAQLSSELLTQYEDVGKSYD